MKLTPLHPVDNDDELHIRPPELYGGRFHMDHVLRHVRERIPTLDIHGWVSEWALVPPFSKTIHSHEHLVLVDLLRRERTAAGLRQADLAGLLGRPQSFVSKYESGERRIDLVELGYICTALGLRLSTFVRRYEKEL